MRTKTTNIKVIASDILKLGFTYYSDDKDLMSFHINVDEHLGLSEIFLRNILECFGDYKILWQGEYRAQFSDLDYDDEDYDEDDEDYYDDDDEDYYDDDDYDDDEDDDDDFDMIKAFHTNLPKNLFKEVAGDSVLIKDLGALMISLIDSI